MIGQCWAKKDWPAMPGVKRVGAEAHDYYGLDSFGLLDREQYWSLSRRYYY